MKGSQKFVVCCVWPALISLGSQANAAEVTLDLRQAQALAVAHQPLLEAIDAQARAAREAAVAVSQLPDPRLFGGVRDLPVTSRDAGSLSDDSDTQIVVGVAQEFPRANKRRLRGAQRLREADRLTAEGVLRQRIIARDAGFAWLDAWREARATTLAQATHAEAQLQVQAVRIAVAAGKASQSELIEAQLAADRTHDTIAAQEQAEARSRADLQRWIGVAAAAPIAQHLPPPEQLPALAELLQSIATHPELLMLQAREQEAAAGVDLAHAAYAPDWRMELAYGNRADYSDMVMLQVGMDLPLFRRNRQDRSLASALALGDAARQLHDDGARRLAADATRVYGDAHRFEQRIAYYNDTIVPRSAAGADAALAAWRSSAGNLRDVIDARRAQLDVALARLDLQRNLAAARLELAYLNPLGA